MQIDDYKYLARGLGEERLRIFFFGWTVPLSTTCLLTAPGWSLKSALSQAVHGL